MKECGATAAETRLTRTHIAVTRLDPTVYIITRFTTESVLFTPERAFHRNHINTVAKKESVGIAMTPMASCKETVFSTPVISRKGTMLAKTDRVNANCAETATPKAPVRMLFLLLTLKKSAPSGQCEYR